MLKKFRVVEPSSYSPKKLFSIPKTKISKHELYTDDIESFNRYGDYKAYATVERCEENVFCKQEFYDITSGEPEGDPVSLRFYGDTLVRYEDMLFSGETEFVFDVINEACCGRSLTDDNALLYVQGIRVEEAGKNVIKTGGSRFGFNDVYEPPMHTTLAHIGQIKSPYIQPNSGAYAAAAGDLAIIVIAGESHPNELDNSVREMFSTMNAKSCDIVYDEKMQGDAERIKKIAAEYAGVDHVSMSGVSGERDGEAIYEAVAITLLGIRRLDNTDVGLTRHECKEGLITTGQAGQLARIAAHGRLDKDPIDFTYRKALQSDAVIEEALRELDEFGLKLADIKKYAETHNLLDGHYDTSL